jgi:hypothetical protein
VMRCGASEISLKEEGFVERFSACCVVYPGG